jgi:hypothetical protein
MWVWAGAPAVRRRKKSVAGAVFMSAIQRRAWSAMALGSESTKLARGAREQTTWSR